MPSIQSTASASGFATTNIIAVTKSTFNVIALATANCESPSSVNKVFFKNPSLRKLRFPFTSEAFGNKSIDYIQN